MGNMHFACIIRFDELSTPGDNGLSMCVRTVRIGVIDMVCEGDAEIGGRDGHSQNNCNCNCNCASNVEYFSNNSAHRIPRTPHPTPRTMGIIIDVPVVAALSVPI